MLVTDFIELDVPYHAVIETLEVAHDELGVWAAAAYQRGERLAMGPGRVMATAVQLKVGKVETGLDSANIPVEWEALTGTTLFPRMSAELVVAPLVTGGTQVAFRGTYDPPLDSFGAMLDRFALHRVAESTVRSFLERLAVAVNTECRS